MANDPAILFYTSDFLTGTALFDYEQIGKYIKLLCIHHQKGRLSEKDMLKICGTYDKDIFDKFKKDEEGNYYNERLELEIDKRKKYAESRRNNRLGKPKPNEEQEEIPEQPLQDMTNISESYVPHMENEIENRNKKIEIPLLLEDNNYSEDFKKFKAFLSKNAPKVEKMKEPFTQLEFEKLTSQFDTETIKSKLMAMHNKVSLTKTYTSAYLTCLTWCKKENNK